MRKATAISAHEATSNVAETAAIQPESIVQARQGIPMGDALSRAHLPDAVPDIEPVMVNIINFIAVAPTRYDQLQECTADGLNELHAIIQK